MIAWIKANKLTAILIVVIAILILKNNNIAPMGGVYLNKSSRSSALDMTQSYSESPPLGFAGKIASNEMMPVPMPEAPPDATVTNRMVIQNSDMSLLVKDVKGTQKKIISIAQENGGYMVNSHLSSPDEAPSGSVVIRVKSVSIEKVLESLRGLAVKVVSENLNGYDVTDQYVDIDKRIAIHESTKAKYQEILGRAHEISDITQITQQIIYTQSQIDSLVGQQDALKKNADLAKITVYLSADEISLPYAPKDTWRPNVVFKLAVRALVKDIRNLADKAIWLGVYSVIWVPLLIAGLLVWRLYIRKKK